MGKKTKTVSYDQITPLKAKNWLEKNHDRQRKLVPSMINKLVKAMKAEKFSPDVNDIVFDEDGRLVNGQNTLTAIVKAGKTYNMAVKRNVPREIVLILMDTGRNRSAVDRYRAAHGDDISHKEFSIIKLLDSPFHRAQKTGGGKEWEDPWMVHPKKVRDEWKEFIELYGGGELNEQGKPAGFSRAPKPLLSAAVIFAIRAFPHQAKELRRWCHIAEYGRPMDGDDPTLSVKEELSARTWFNGEAERAYTVRNTMTYLRELTRILWIFLEHEHGQTVSRSSSNPFADFY